MNVNALQDHTESSSILFSSVRSLQDALKQDSVAAVLPFNLRKHLAFKNSVPLNMEVVFNFHS